jgi:hypothetical protein
MDIDFRWLFGHRTRRDVEAWEMAPKAVMFGPKQTAATKTLIAAGVMYIPANSSPPGVIFPILKDRCEFIVYRPPVTLFYSVVDAEHYYVNTDRHEYARNILRIPSNIMRRILKEMNESP